jgi:hypothetical protein
MKKSMLAVAVLMAALVFAIFAFRRERGQVVDVPEAERTPIGAPTGHEVAPTPRAASQRRAVRQEPRVTFNPEMFGPRSTPADEVAASPSWERGRDPSYDRLLLRQGRDQAKEQQLQTKLLAVFGDRPDTLVGSTECSSQFCRVELRGIGKVDIRDIRDHWQSEVISAVEPKGLTMFLVDDDDEGNTIMSCYFGRDESWTVPDPRALGLL